MVTISKRISTIEQELGGRGGCPECWRRKDVDWDNCVLLVGEGDKEEIPTCPACGRRPKNVLIQEIGVNLEAI